MSLLCKTIDNLVIINITNVLRLDNIILVLLFLTGKLLLLIDARIIPAVHGLINLCLCLVLFRVVDEVVLLLALSRAVLLTRAELGFGDLGRAAVVIVGFTSTFAVLLVSLSHFSDDVHACFLGTTLGDFDVGPIDALQVDEREDQLQLSMVQSVT